MRWEFQRAWSVPTLWPHTHCLSLVLASFVICSILLLTFHVPGTSDLLGASLNFGICSHSFTALSEAPYLVFLWNLSGSLPDPTNLASHMPENTITMIPGSNASLNSSQVPLGIAAASSEHLDDSGLENDFLGTPEWAGLPGTLFSKQCPQVIYSFTP